MRILKLFDIILSIHRSKSSNWLRLEFMFGNKSMCFIFLIQLSKKLSQLLNLEINTVLSRFYRSAWTKKQMNWCVKNSDCSFVQGMVEIIVSLVKIQPWSTNDLVHNNFPPFPSWVVNTFMIKSGPFHHAYCKIVKITL